MAINESSIQAAAKARTAITATSGRKMIGEILIMQNVINSRQLDQARSRQKDGPDSKLPIGAILIKLGFATEEDITRARALQMNIGYATPEQLSSAANIGAEVIGTIPAEIALQNVVLPVGRSSDGLALRVVSSNWTNASYDAVKNAAAALDLGIEALLGSEKYVRAAVLHHYGKSANGSSSSRLNPPANGSAAPGQNGRVSPPSTSAVPVVVEDPSAPLRG